MMQSSDYSKKKRSITWVSADYFVDTDFQPAVLSGLLQHFDIYWLILLPAQHARYAEPDFEEIKKLPGLQVEFFYWTSKARNPKMLLFYERVYQRIRSLNTDLVYFNDVPSSPYILPLYLRLNKRKTIVTAHDGNVKSSFKMPWLSKMVFKQAFGRMRYVHMFSASQAAIFKAGFKQARVFTIPLGLKDFGSSAVPKRQDEIIFLFFGSIHSNKNLGLLIDAACNLYDKGVRGFKISIHGACTDWAPYQAAIRHPSIFECDIRMHRNDEIPRLFAESHYAVFPYKDISQSGAIKVAFNYKLPVIVSDLEAFTDEVKEGINGYIFESNNVQELEQVMAERIRVHLQQYPVLLQNIAQYNQQHFAADALKDKYMEMFNAVLTANK
ncbi:MAG: glycosyltransferase [Chitinophagaceae bacterium]